MKIEILLLMLAGWTRRCFLSSSWPSPAWMLRRRLKQRKPLHGSLCCFCRRLRGLCSASKRQLQSSARPGSGLPKPWQSFSRSQVSQEPVLKAVAAANGGLRISAVAEAPGHGGPLACAPSPVLFQGSRLRDRQPLGQPGLRAGRGIRNKCLMSRRSGEQLLQRFDISHSATH